MKTLRITARIVLFSALLSCLGFALQPQASAAESHETRTLAGKYHYLRVGSGHGHLDY